MKLSSVLCVLLVACGMSPSTANGAGPVWSFVVMGDTRDTITETLRGISPDLPRLAEAIAAEKPDLVLHTGDLANGYYTTTTSPMHGKYREMFRNWKAAVRPIYDFESRRGAFIYLVRENHEDGKFVTDGALKQAYEEEFAGLMPQNGPENERGLTYSFTHKGARFFALDAYHKTHLMIVRGYVNQQWLGASLAKDTRPFTFAFAHTPAYKVGDYHESPFPDLYSHPRDRDAFWASLKRGGAVAYFSGHIHFYCRGTIDGIEQVVVGNGGADTVPYDATQVDPIIAMHYPTAPMKASSVHTGYLLMTVNEEAGTVTGVQKVWNERENQWEKGDVFTLRAR